MAKRLLVEIDGDVCIGSGNCELIAPAAFKVDEDSNVATILDPDTEADEQLRAAEEACPTGAIRLVEGFE